MKKSIIFLFLFLFIPVFTCPGQEDVRYLSITELPEIPRNSYEPEPPHLKIKAKVMEIPETIYDQEPEPPQFLFVNLKYKVLGMCEGEYYEDEIKVAQGVVSKRKLKVGDEIILEVKTTTEFREVAEKLRQVRENRSLTYRVLKVLEGVYDEDEIKGAQETSPGELKEADEITWEEDIADYILVDFTKSDSCF